MKRLKKNARLIFLRSFFILIFIALIVGVIAYARGYRYDFAEKSISSTGILAISSSPKGSKVYLNGKLRGVTDLNLTLPPGRYEIEIKKEGFTAYKKSVTLRGELVETIDPVLFPKNPSLSPLTNLGIVKAIQVDQTNRIILLSEKGDEQDGIYLFDAGNKPISFFPPLKILALKSSFPAEISLKTAQIYLSYDYKQAIFDFPLEDETRLSYLLSLDSESQEPFDVTLSKDTLIDAWTSEKNQEALKILEALPKEIRKIATDSFNIISISPDQTKLLYKARDEIKLPLVIEPPLIAANQTKEERNLEKDILYVYDKKEDKNFKIGDSALSENIIWYFDSKRLIYREPKQISISLYDGENKQVVYSGPLEEGFLASKSDGKLLILANLNPQTNKLPDLYLVGIR